MGSMARHVRDLYAQHGTDVWFEREASDTVSLALAWLEGRGDESRGYQRLGPVRL